MIKHVIYNIFIPCFIFALSTVLYIRLMTSFCLQKVKKVYKVDHVAKENSYQKTFVDQHAFLNIILNHEKIYATFIQRR